MTTLVPASYSTSTSVTNRLAALKFSELSCGAWREADKNAHPQLLTHRDSAHSIHNLYQHTTGEFATEREIPKAEIVRFDKVDEACLAVIQEKADAVIFEHPYLVKYVNDRPDQLEGLWEPFTSEAIAVAIRKDSPQLLAAVDALLKSMETSGDLAALQAKWFPEPGAAPQAPADDAPGSE